jgi:hypothetical protein
VYLGDTAAPFRLCAFAHFVERFYHRRGPLHIPYQFSCPTALPDISPLTISQSTEVADPSHESNTLKYRTALLATGSNLVYWIMPTYP